MLVIIEIYHFGCKRSISKGILIATDCLVSSIYKTSYRIWIFIKTGNFPWVWSKTHWGEGMAKNEKKLMWKQNGEGSIIVHTLEYDRKRALSTFLEKIVSKVIEPPKCYLRISPRHSWIWRNTIQCIVQGNFMLMRKSF